jgi:hypothetical protein
LNLRGWFGSCIYSDAMSTTTRMRLAAAALSVTACGLGSDVSAPSTPTTPPQPNASLAGRRPFPADNAWNTDISASPIDPNSATLIASCGNKNLHSDFGTVFGGAPNGIPYVVVHSGQAKVAVTFDFADESRSREDQIRRATGT